MPRHNGYAVFSACSTYRYELGGDIGPQEPLSLFHTSPVSARDPILWIMANPSKAGAQDTDPTVSTTVVFSEIWGYNRYMVGNLSAFVSTDPRGMKRAHAAGTDIVGPDNDRHLIEMIGRVRSAEQSGRRGRIMVAWGKGADPERVRQVMSLVQGDVYCLKTNQDGSPVHPLYQPHRLEPFVWRAPWM